MRTLAAILAAIAAIAFTAATTSAATSAPVRIPGEAPPAAVTALGDLTALTGLAISDNGATAAGAFNAEKAGRSVVRISKGAGAAPAEISIRGRVRALRFSRDDADLFVVAARDAKRENGDAFLLRITLATLDVSREIVLPRAASDVEAIDAGTLLVSGPNELRTFYVPSLSSGPLYRLEGSNRALASIPGTRRLLVAHDDAIVTIDLDDLQSREGLTPHERLTVDAPVVALAVAPDGSAALARHENGQVERFTIEPLGGVVADGQAVAIAWPGLRKAAPPPAPRSQPSSPAPTDAGPAPAANPPAAPPEPPAEQPQPSAAVPQESAKPQSTAPPTVQAPSPAPPELKPPAVAAESAPSKPQSPAPPAESAPTPQSEPPAVTPESAPPSQPEPPAVAPDSAPPPQPEPAPTPQSEPPAPHPESPTPEQETPAPQPELPASPPETAPPTSIETAPAPVKSVENVVVLRGAVIGDAAAGIAAVVILGPNNVLREAARAKPAADGSWSVTGLVPGTYRVQLDAGSGRAVEASPAFRTVRIERTGTTEVAPIEARRVL